MKKYNCFEELKEQFQPYESFECEGETFKMVAQFVEQTPVNTVLLKNTRKGIIIKLPFSTSQCITFHYHSV